MMKAGIDQDALITMFAEASAKPAARRIIAECRNRSGHGEKIDDDDE